jgi:hypothetical protein
LIQNTLNNSDTIDDTKLNEYIETIYFNFLSGIVNLKYADRENSDNLEDYIWYNNI